MERSKSSVTAAIVVLAIFHEVGVIGLHLESTRSLFQSLVPLNLLLSLGVLAWFHRVWSLQFGIFAFMVFWGGYLVELVGVKTAAIFGAYVYGDALGPKVAGVPPMIGVNWLILVYITGIISQKVTTNIWIKAFIGAALMVFLDLLIEPTAIRFDFWTWQEGHIPPQNYVAWFFIGFIMQYGFHSLHQEKSNPLAYPLFLIQIIFFTTFIVVAW